MILRPPSIAFKTSVGLSANPALEEGTLQRLCGVSSPAPASNGEPRWLALARRYSGLKEIKGSQNNPEIVNMWKTLGLPFRDDETSWCAGFVFESCGIFSTRSGLAKPVIGCVVTFKRTGGGRVGFVTGRDQAGNHMVLGGNQSDAVNIKPFATGRVTSYRWPKGERLPDGSLQLLASPKLHALTRSLFTYMGSFESRHSACSMPKGNGRLRCFDV